MKAVILAGGLVIVATGSSAQVLIGVLVSLTYLLFLVRLEPFDDIVEDRMQMATTLQILLTLIKLSIIIYDFIYIIIGLVDILFYYVCYTRS